MLYESKNNPCGSHVGKINGTASRSIIEAPIILICSYDEM